LARPRLGLLVSTDIHRAPHKMHQIPRRVQNRMAECVDVFGRAVTKKDSKLHLVIRFFTDCSIGCLLPLGSILRMNAGQPFFPSRQALFWIEAIYAIPFLREM